MNTQNWGWTSHGNTSPSADPALVHLQVPPSPVESLGFWPFPDLVTWLRVQSTIEIDAFPMVFVWFTWWCSTIFMVFLWFSSGFCMVHLWFTFHGIISPRLRPLVPVGGAQWETFRRPRAARWVQFTHVVNQNWLVKGNCVFNTMVKGIIVVTSSGYLYYSG